MRESKAIKACQIMFVCRMNVEKIPAMADKVGCADSARHNVSKTAAREAVSV